MLHTTILVAEDERQTRDAICLVLENAGYSVLSVDTGPEARATIERHRGSEMRIGLLILDVEMDGLTGVKVLESLRSQADLTPAVVVTGLAGAEILPRLCSLGHVEVLAKPFDPQQLTDAVSKALEDRAGSQSSTNPADLQGSAERRTGIRGNRKTEAQADAEKDVL